MPPLTKIEELQAEINRLKAELGESNLQRSAAEEVAQAMAMASAFGGASEEQPTGRTVTMSVCLNPGVKDEKKQKFKDIELPTYYYTIQLPAGAGVCLWTNGSEYYHGETYEFDTFALAEMKDRVAKCWAHEKSIHGENENAYRKPTNKHLITAAARQRGAH